MVNISVGNGQGITQAIASNLGLSSADCKKINLSTWTKVMTLVDQNNQQNKAEGKDSIFTGGNNVNNINNKASWKTDFQVKPNQQLNFDESIWSKIKELLTGKPQEVKKDEPTQQNTSKTEASSPSVSAPEAAKPVAVTTKVETPAPAQPVPSAQQVEETGEAQLLQKGKEMAETFKAMPNIDDVDLINEDVELQITDDNWRALAGKKDKTDAEKQQLDTQYKTNIKTLGRAYTTYIDKTYGNGDGVLSQDEYTKFEETIIPEILKDDPEAAQLPSNAFKHLDLNKDGSIDHEEMSSYLYAIDFGTEEGKSNGSNGKISAYDFMSNSIALGKSEKNMIDQKLAYTYNALFGKKPVE